MTRLAFSTNAFKKNTLAEAVEAIASIGYGGVELMADVPHAYPPTFTKEQRAALKQQLKRLGIEVSNINAFTHFADGDTYHPTWIEEDRERREKRIAHTLVCVELAAEFGASTLSLQPGGPMIGTTITRAVAGQRFADGLGRVVDRARELGIVLAVEPEPGLFIETAAEYAAFKTKFFPSDAVVKMNCDIGHLFCVGEDPAAVIRAMPGEVAHVHLEDIGSNRVHQHLTPGKGVIDFRQILSALVEIAYAGWVTIELYPYEATAAEVAFMAWEYLKPIL